MSPEDFQKELDKQSTTAQKQQNKQAEVGAINKAGIKNVEATNANTKSTAEGLKNIKGNVNVTNPDLAKTGDLNNVLEGIKELNLTTFMGAGGYQSMAANMKALADEVQTLQKNYADNGLTTASNSLNGIVTKFIDIAKMLTSSKVGMETKLQKTLDGLSTQIAKIEFNPSVNVSAPQPKVVATPVNLDPVVNAIQDLKESYEKVEEKEDTPVDFSPLINGLQSVQDAIANQRFPVPNYVLPFKDVNGKAAQVQLDSSGNIPTSAGDFQVPGVAAIGSVLRASISDQNTTITSSTAATTIVTAVAATYLDLVSLVLTNTSATGSEVQLYNDDGTTARSVFYVPANDVRGIVFSTPFIQAAVNKTWKLATITSIASLKVTAQFVKNT